MAGYLQGIQCLQSRRLPFRHRSGFPRRRRRLHGLRSSHHQLAQPGSESPRSHVHQTQGHRRGLIPGRQRRHPDQVRRQTPCHTSSNRLNKARLHPAQGHIPRSPHPQTERTLVPLPETVAGTPPSTGTGRPGRSIPASTPVPPIPTAKRTRTPRPTTPWNGSSNAGNVPRRVGRKAPGAGGKPSGGSTGATAAYAESGTMPSTR